MELVIILGLAVTVLVLIGLFLDVWEIWKPVRHWGEDATDTDEIPLVFP